MIRMISLLCIALIFQSLSAQKKEKNTTLKPLDSLTKSMIKDVGLITTYLNEENKLYFAIDSTLLGEDLLVVTRYAQLPANFSPYRNAGSKTAEQVIRFVKKGKKIFIKQISYTQIADKEDPIARSVSENNFYPILAAFDIKNKETDRFLIDVSAYFMADSPGFNIIRKSEKDRYKIGSVDKKRSSLDSAKSFPKNTEIRHTLTFNANKAPRSNTSKTFSFQINHSFIALPTTLLPLRYEDERVGWFSLRKINYSSPELKADELSVVRRWRLIPKDTAAYFRGELVEPEQPIVYYLDPATPIKWRPYFKQGIEDWNTAFEKAGFKNAIIAKDPPTAQEDPEFSPEDIRYSTVRYVASTTRNATGPSVSDPRTGEILESDIIWYHNHLRSYRNRYLLETAAANPKARTLTTPEKEIGEMMRRVISHEIGHALGLPHNMKASSAYPVDSLRSGTFTQKYGIATTIMDYARYNYVAQPGDENIRFVRQLGPYDDYAIEWGYRYFGQDSKEEKKLLSAFVDQKSLDPIYMFGGYGNDPNAQTENIGDDPIKASDYGLRNLKVVTKNLKSWVLSPGKGYADLDELYGELVGVYRRYVYHVLSIVGGVNQTLHQSQQTGVVTYQNVSQNEQQRALEFLQQHLWRTQNWLFPTAIVTQIKRQGTYTTIQNIQRAALYRLLSTRKLNQILSTQATLQGNALTTNALIETLFSSIVLGVNTPDIFEQNLQLNYAHRLNELMEEEDLNPTIKGQLQAIKKKLNKTARRFEKSKDKHLQAHFAYLCTISSSD